MITAILSLINNAFGMAFNAWAKLVVPIMVVESLIEIVLINLVESWTSRRNEE